MEQEAGDVVSGFEFLVQNERSLWKFPNQYLSDFVARFGSDRDVFGASLDKQNVPVWDQVESTIKTSYPELNNRQVRELVSSALRNVKEKRKREGARGSGVRLSSERRKTSGSR